MADKEDNGTAIPILRWSGKGGSGVSVMHGTDKDGNVSPWTGQQLADELNTHAKLGNKVTFAAIHGGKIVGDSSSEKSTAKKPAAKPAVKPTAKAAEKKPATKKVEAKPVAKAAEKKPAVKPAAKKAK